MRSPFTRAVTIGLVALPLCAVSLTLGCNSNQNDATLFGGDESPTQIQRDAMGSGPTPAEEMLDPEDGTSQDPFTDNPNYPYQPNPSMDSPNA